MLLVLGNRLGGALIRHFNDLFQRDLTTAHLFKTRLEALRFEDHGVHTRGHVTHRVDVLLVRDEHRRKQTSDGGVWKKLRE